MSLIMIFQGDSVFLYQCILHYLLPLWTVPYSGQTFCRRRGNR